MLTRRETLSQIKEKMSLLNDSHHALSKQLSLAVPRVMNELSSSSSSSHYCLIGVESLYRVSWDCYILLCLLFQAFWIPLSLGLDIPLKDWLVYLDIIITFTFIMDILINFNTTVNDRGSIIKSRWQIAKSYLRLWFWIDIFASFPYDWVISGSVGQDEESLEESSISKAPQLLRLLKILRFVRMLKLLRLAKLKQIMFRIEDYMSSELMYIIFTMSRMAIVIFFIAHWTACAFYYTSELSSTEFPENYVTDLDYSFQMSLSPIEKYITTLYWATTTMITLGYGDISANNPYEMVAAIICMAISCGYYAYILGKITGFISEKLERDKERSEKHMALNRYLKKQNLPYALYFKVKRYLNYISDIHQRELEQEDFMETLSIPIKNDIYTYLYKHSMDSCKIIDFFPQFLVSSLIKMLSQETFSPEDVVVQEGNTTRKIYFIRTGVVDIFHFPTKTLLSELRDGDSFGDIGFFLGRARSASAMCMKFTEFMTLTWKDVVHEIAKYPLVMEYLDVAYKESVDGDYSSLRLQCYICADSTHIAPSCPLVLVPNNHQETKNKWIASKGKPKIVQCPTDMPDIKHRVTDTGQNSHYTASERKFLYKMQKYKTGRDAEKSESLESSHELL